MKPSTAAPAPSRLGWLDALRGLAALAVAMHHFGLVNLIPHAAREPHYLDLGLFGVMLFFLVSGYIIPASLERRGDVRAFWAGRFFRIYPAVAVTVVVSLLILPRDFAVVQGFAFDHPLLSLAANGLMLQDMMGLPSAIGVLWSLTYEMIFYYFVTALFVLGWHRRSAPIAIGFAAFALVLGSWLAVGTLSTDLTSIRHLVTACGIVVLMAMVCIGTARPDLVRWGALLLGGLGLTLILLNSRSSAFETMMIFATMFAGTVLYRLEHGQIDRLPAILCCVFVTVCGVASGYFYDRGTTTWKTWTDSWMAFSFAYLAAWAVFAVGMLLRRRRFPRWLSGLGAISFSVYLLHGPLDFFTGWQLSGHAPLVGWKERGLLLVAYLAALVVLAYLSYRLVEIPFQNLGRTVMKAVNRRFPAPAAPRPRVDGRAEPPAEAAARSAPVLSGQD
ncbi:acyltransferase [Streptomyces kaniharaensis]|uniref:Acyltransferase n=1 Tax=Streptomyces kaniharaensis TaxID=212423 RepID=A0A6N7KUW1_9ACTN|nr:acyltransferase [Streptomyces kaniharaensis]MQS14107.1 acyltransferase [Streptomyces kaniharaensis]